MSRYQRRLDMVVMIRALVNLYGFSMKVSVLKSAQNFLGSLYEYVNKLTALVE